MSTAELLTVLAQLFAHHREMADGSLKGVLQAHITFVLRELTARAEKQPAQVAP